MKDYIMINKAKSVFLGIILCVRIVSRHPVG